MTVDKRENLTGDSNLSFSLYLQNHGNNNSNNSMTTNQNNINNLQQQQHQKVLRWGLETSHRAVGSPVLGASSPTGTTFQHQTISRRNSNPVTSERISMTSLVNSVSTLILDNIREQQQQQPPPPGHRKLDRSQSEPAPSALSAASAKAANINTSRYKTELCRPFEESGSCKYGDKCQFAHGSHELRNLVRHPKYKTELCRTFHTIGFCPYGPRCHFIHNADEARTKVPGTQTVAAGTPAAAPTTQSAGIPNRPKPLNLASSPFIVTGSTADSPSPTSSLSQSPTTSVGSFFSSEQDVFPTVAVMSASSPPPSTTCTANTAFSFGQDFTPLVHLGGGKQQSPPPASPPISTSPTGSLSPRGSPPPGTPDSRLPVFNRLSSSMMDFGGLAELLA
jgi:tristetraprolin